MTLWYSPWWNLSKIFNPWSNNSNHPHFGLSNDVINEKGYSRRQSMVWLPNQWQSSWGSTQAQLGLARLASTNTESLWQPCLRKTCYHSCETDSVLDSKGLNAFAVTTLFSFLLWIAIFFKFGIGKKLWPSKAVPIASLNLLIIDWSLSKNMTYEQISIPNWISSRSKLTNSPRKGHLLRFNLNSTATSDGFWKNLETMSIMVLNQLQPRFADKSVAEEMWCLQAMYCWQQHFY